MTVVLDWTAVVAVAVNDRTRAAPVAAAIDTGSCYMAPAAVAETYYWLLENANRDLADYWLRFMMSGRDIRVDAAVDTQLVEMVAEARRYNASPAGSFSAALARKKDIPVMTAALEFTELRRSGFCAVILI